MAATTTPILGLTKPDTANSVDTWGDELLATIDVLDAHNHTEHVSNAITPAAMNINAALDFDTNNLTSLGILGFDGVASSAVLGSLWRRSSDNELIWRTAAGVDVQLTNGASLNATLLGGITGDYATSTADVEYSDSLQVYDFLQAESPDHYAGLRTGAIKISEEVAGIVNGVTLQSPSALAAGYALTFPASLPADTRTLMVDASGVLSAGPSPQRTRSIPVTQFKLDDASSATRVAWAGNGSVAFGPGAAAGDIMALGVPVEQGAELNGVALRMQLAGTLTVTTRLFHDDGTTQTQLGTTQTKTTATEETISITGLTHDVSDALDTYWIEVEITAHTTGSVTVKGATYTETEPTS